mmetsp:Transcript_4418/g.6462  ORF Transcript_4418/g.6462 Transcript_4418/m.6462 type:complete len:89 (+) Transcript_4418:119-385(+)
MIRYEGKVDKIDKAANTIRLLQVKHFGTEGRRDGENEVPPNEGIKSRLIFKLAFISRLDIKDSSEVDPAIVQEDDDDDEPAQKDRPKF